ncbi:MAG: hypothetical protein JW699_03280 [Chitinispirillaceae bacterium]|nr:hypothetical protein [Chitinispirillaceae bacterium]
MKKSSTSTAELRLTFARVALARLVMPDALFDERVVADNAVPEPLTPMIITRNGEAFTIIDGCKRLAILKRQKKKDVVCGIVSKSLSPEKAGLLRIALNANRQLSRREKLLFIGWLRSHLSRKEYLKQCEQLRLPANERHEYEQLLECKPWLVEAVTGEKLDAAVAPEMNHLTEPDAGALLALFSTLSFSRQMQRELAEWLPEIAFLRKMPLPELLGSAPFAGILADKRLNDPQKVAKIHEEAHSSRFPLYSEIKKTWFEQARRINPDASKVLFQSSPYFEKNSLEIRIKTENAEETQRIIRQLASVDLHKWQELIDPCAGAVPPLPDIRPDEDST